MKPPPFAYHRPANIGEAVEILESYEGDAKPLAGGQSLMPLLSLRLARPSALVDINEIPELMLKRFTHDELIIGAMVRERAVETDSRIASRFAAIADAVPLIGHVGIRNRGTVGGSIAHGDPAAEWPALCLLFDATMEATGRRGKRSIGANQFFQGFLTIALEPDELLTAIRFPVPQSHTGTAFREITRRHGDYAIVGLGALLEFGVDNQITKARIALTGVSLAPVRAHAAEEFLTGKEYSSQLLEAAADAVADEMRPPTDLLGDGDYRRQLCRVLTRRVLPLAAHRATSEDHK